MAVTVRVSDIYFSKSCDYLPRIYVASPSNNQPLLARSILHGGGMVQITPDNLVDVSESWFRRRSSTRVRIKAFEDLV